MASAARIVMRLYGLLSQRAYAAANDRLLPEDTEIPSEAADGLVEAHIVEGRSVSELAAAHGAHRSWIYKLLARYRAGGYGAARRPGPRMRSSRRSSPCASNCGQRATTAARLAKVPVATTLARNPPAEARKTRPVVAQWPGNAARRS